MAKDSKDKLRSMRETERMGISRDTVKDPPRMFDEPTPPHHPVLGPRGTMVTSPQPLPQPQPQPAPKPAAPPDGRREAGQIVIGNARRPAGAGSGKVDVSRADPRRAPTRKLDRRPEQYLPRDESVARERAQRPRRRKMNMTTLGLIVVVVLTLIALALGGLVLIQSKRAELPGLGGGRALADRGR